MLPAKKNRLLIALLYRYAHRLYRRHFHRIFFVPGPTSFDQPGLFPCLFYGNHHTWWDGMLELLLFRRNDIEWFVMMEEKNLRRYAYFRHCGCFGVNLDDPRGGTAPLLYAVRLLRGEPSRDRGRRVLLLYPHGELRNPFADPAPFHPGISAIARLSQRPALPLAKYIVPGHDPRPDAWIMTGPRQEPGSSADDLERALDETCRHLRERIASRSADDAIQLF